MKTTIPIANTEYAARREGGSRVSVGIDVGGTFTDLVAVREDGAVITRKVPTTAFDQSDGVEQALRQLGEPNENVERVVHGTTVATNMLLERAGARVVLCATAGATDLLELRRQERASLYDLSQHHPEPLVPSALVVAVNERRAPGTVVTSLTSNEASRVAEAVAALKPDAVAIVLLHAYENADHERLLASAIRERLAGVDVILSSEVYPEIREYERASTTVAEAFLRKGVARYLGRLVERLGDMALPSPGVMLSSGGMRPAAEAARSAAALALSGPAGGVIGAAAIACEARISHALSIDIGGTSADVGLIIDGAPYIDAGGSIAGIPIALPRVLVETVSAGGGSVGWIDSGGVLRVGPHSAGMSPGPAAFGRGGKEPTVTDAHVVLGNIVARKLSADVAIDLNAARAAIEKIAVSLASTVERVAEAMIAIADAEMARALRRLSVDRGIDPRAAVLIAFGGGGPLHACGLAEQIGITRVLVPPHAGVLSALGLAISSEQHVAIQSIMQPASRCDADFLAGVLDQAAHRVTTDGAATGAAREWWLRCRYQGQGHELETVVRPGDPSEVIADRFAGVHLERYGFTLDREVEFVSIRCVAQAPGRPIRFSHTSKSRDVEVVHGRATVALSDATMLVGAGWTARPHVTGGWLLEENE